MDGQTGANLNALRLSLREHKNSYICAQFKNGLWCRMYATMDMKPPGEHRYENRKNNIMCTVFGQEDKCD